MTDKVGPQSVHGIGGGRYTGIGGGTYAGIGGGAYTGPGGGLYTGPGVAVSTQPWRRSHIAFLAADSIQALAADSIQALAAVSTQALAVASSRARRRHVHECGRQPAGEQHSSWQNVPLWTICSWANGYEPQARAILKYLPDERIINIKAYIRNHVLQMIDFSSQ